MPTPPPLAESWGAEELAATLDSVGTGIWALDFEGRCVFINQAACRTLGYRREECLGEKIQCRIHAGHCDGWVCPKEACCVQSALQSGSAVEMDDDVFRRRDGTSIAVKYSIQPVVVEGRMRGSVIGMNETANGFLRTLIERLPDLIYAKDNQGRFLLANSSVAKMMGAPAVSDLLGKTDFDFYPKGLATKYYADEQRICQTGEPLVDLEEPGVDPEGRPRWLLTSKVPFHDGSGKIIGLVGLGRDITGRRLAEEALRESEAKFRELFDCAPVAYHELDLDGVVCRVNRAECALLGYEAGEMLGRPIWEFIAGAEREASREVLRRKLSGEQPLKPYQRRYLQRDGGELWVEIHDVLVRNATGETVGIRTALLDITGRKRAEQAAEHARQASERSHSFLRTLIESLPDLIYAKDDQGRFTVANSAVARAMGVSAVSDLLGKTDFDFYPKELATQYQADEQRILQAGQRLVDCEEPGVDPEGNPIWKLTTKVAFHDASGRVIGLVGLSRDITERKCMAEAIERHAEKLARSNAELERFAYVASHDLQEPLRMVASFTQLLAKRYSGQLDETANRYIYYAVDGAKRMQQLITDLLAYSRVNSKELDLRQTECEALVVGAMRNLQAAIDESGASVDWDPLPVLWVDQGQLTQLFQNLLGNAIKFRAKGECPRIHVSAVDGGVHWVLSVQDNGIGIDPRQAERVFQIFQRLHSRAEYPGTGIGLAVCQKVAERHGGKIWVESEPGVGSTFRFTIPKPAKSE